MLVPETVKTAEPSLPSSSCIRQIPRARRIRRILIHQIIRTTHRLVYETKEARSVLVSALLMPIRKSAEPQTNSVTDRTWYPSAYHELRRATASPPRA